MSPEESIAELFRESIQKTLSEKELKEIKLKTKISHCDFLQEFLRSEDALLKYSAAYRIIEGQLFSNEPIRLCHESSFALTTPQKAIQFCLLTGESSNQLKEVCCKNPGTAYKYALLIEKAPSEQTRIAVANSVVDSFYYAKLIDKGATDTTRNAVCNSSYYFPSENDNIPHGVYPFYYAKDIDQMPSGITWDAVKKSSEILKDDYYSKLYYNFYLAWTKLQRKT